MTMIAGLRERKKEQTRATLADAAYALVREHGAAALTAEAVATRAGVSRRTFFNYFPSVESACAASVEGVLADLTAALSARPREESVWDTIPIMLGGPEGSAILERIAVLAAGREDSPQMRHLAHDHVDAFVAWLTGWLRDRLGTEADELYAAALAAAVVAVAEVSVLTWADRTGGRVTPETLELHRTLLTRGLALLRSGFEHPTP
ncbi:MAG: TetR/AcrR family transcriptional regulator [Actinobacteria bacterium]|nr:TetR/AcrR family transcriptional regulator [Actinomycetota bacterium]